MFELTSKTIITMSKQPLHKDAGGIATFEGRVRSVNEGKSVAALEYEAYPALVISEGNKIIATAITEFGLFSAYAVHRTGHLEIGEMAVWVHVSSMHRGEAFKGCEFIIGEIKHRLPIWKKEFYAEGTHEWVLCNHQNSENA